MTTSRLSREYQGIFHERGQLRGQEGESERGREGEKLKQAMESGVKTEIKRDHRQRVFPRIIV
jgi:hypothetical protein